jgi:hypothetical protein
MGRKIAPGVATAQAVLALLQGQTAGYSCGTDATLRRLSTSWRRLGYITSMVNPPGKPKVMHGADSQTPPAKPVA